jgi:hypothetical protein
VIQGELTVFDVFEGEGAAGRKDNEDRKTETSTKSYFHEFATAVFRQLNQNFLEQAKAQ